MNSKIKELLSNTLLFTVANMGSKLLVFLMVPLYTAVLSTTEYGISDMVQTTATLLIPILTAMIPDAVLRFCFFKDYSSREVFSIGLRITIFGIFICIFLSILFVFIPFFKDLGGYVWFIPLLFLTNSFVQLLHKYARGVDKVKISAYAGLIGTSSTIILNLLMLLVFKIGILGYLLAFCIADLISIVYMSINCNITSIYTNARNNELRNDMLKYSVPLVPNSLSWWALSSVSRYLMLAWLGVSAVGIYSATLRIPTILTVLSDIFAQAWLLSALKDYGSSESKRFIKSMHNKYFAILIVVTAVIIMLSHPLASFLLSGEFSNYWWVTPYLFISVFWGALVGFLGSIFSSERKNTMQFISTIIGAAVSILISIIYLTEYGVVVVAIATMVGYYVIWLIRRLAVKKYLDVGMGVSYSSFQGLILLSEAVLVSNCYYIMASFCVLVLILLNINDLYLIASFGLKELNIYLMGKIKK